MPYLTTDEYEDRFGNPETLRLTDTGRTGQVDTEKVETAIEDATEFANSFLGGRYVLPIATPPELLRKAVADLAREALHTTKPTEAVTLAADRARTLLKDLSAGRATIPAPALGPGPVLNPGDLPAVSNDRRRRTFTDEALCDFTNLGGCGYGGMPFGGFNY